MTQELIDELNKIISRGELQFSASDGYWTDVNREIKYRLKSKEPRKIWIVYSKSGSVVATFEQKDHAETFRLNCNFTPPVLFQEQL